MEGIELKLSQVVVRCLLGSLSMFEPMAGTSWTYGFIQSSGWFNLPPTIHPPSPLSHPVTP